MQEEKAAYENKLKQLDIELLEKNSQLEIKNNEGVKLQEDNKKLIQIIQKGKVKFITS